MSEKKKTFTIVLVNSAYGKERPYTMLRFAYTALLEDHKINIFLVEDGVFVGKKDQDPASYDNVGKWMADVIREGAVVKACGVCTKARGVNADELIDGIEITTMNSGKSLLVTIESLAGDGRTYLQDFSKNDIKTVDECITIIEQQLNEMK